MSTCKCLLIKKLEENSKLVIYVVSYLYKGKFLEKFKVHIIIFIRALIYK